MESATNRSFMYWGTIILGLFLMLSGFSPVQAQEEGVQDIQAVLFEAESDGAIERDGTTTELTPTLLDFSVEHADDAPKMELEKARSLDAFSVEGVHDISIQLAVFGFLFLLLFTMMAFLVRNSSYGKKFVFSSMVFVILAPSFFFIFSTIYINFISDTKGPVHWHTDFQIYACGEELVPPEPPHTLSNKTGTPVLHQHEDKRVHVEGVLIDELDASFQNFVRVQGGELTKSSFKVPTGDGFKEFTNGDSCPDGKPGEWNVFKYSVNTETDEVSKEKLTDYVNYVPAPYIEVPPGDCVIFEFGPRVDTTSHICDFYQIEINKGNLTPTWTR